MEQQREIHESRRQEHQNFEAERLSKGNTALHGYVELVKEIVRLCPETVAAENRKMETPFHVACREGHATILELLLETDDSRGKNVIRSLLFMACNQGHAEVVKVILNHNNLHTSGKIALNDPRTKNLSMDDLLPKILS